MLKLNQTTYGLLTYQKSVKPYTKYIFGYPTNSVWSHKSYSSYNSNKCCHHVRLKKTFFHKIIIFFIFCLFYGLCLTVARFIAIMAKITLMGWKDIYFIWSFWIANSLSFFWKTDKLISHFKFYIGSLLFLSTILYSALYFFTW